jgi:hypothetical protein
MGGGLMQLVAYGAQDIYLTGNPQITFFKVVYRRHTNFSMESIVQTINGAVTTSGSSTVTISRNGDLVHKIYVTNAKNTSTTNGSAIVSEVELEIGGQRIDRHYEEWNQIWNELSTPESKAIGLKSMVGDIGTAGAAGSTGPLMTQYPLNFWFCRNPGLALPLIALQYHEVKLKFTWGDAATKGVDGNVQVCADYIYLDTDERRRFAQVSHEYLIEQIQKQSAGGTGLSDKLNFNHPVKELIWTSQASSGYTTAKLQLNGHDRFAEQNAEYFQLRQPFDYHTAVPRQNLPTSARVSLLDRSIVLEQMYALLQAEGAASTGAAGDNKIFFTNATNTLTISGQPSSDPADAAAMLALFPLGTQLVVACNLGDTTNFAKSTGNAIPGDLFFGSVVSVGAGTTSDGTNGLLSVVLTPPTTNTTSPLTLKDIKGTTGKALLYKVTNGNSAQARTSQMTKEINVYSFGLKPEEHQPSGTCNFSRIDNAKLQWTGTQPTSSENIYAVNYNVLRIMSGMGGLAYSN